MSMSQVLSLRIPVVFIVYYLSGYSVLEPGRLAQLGLRARDVVVGGHAAARGRAR